MTMLKVNTRIVGALLCVLALACRDDSESSSTENFLTLSGPTVFIAPGLLRSPQGVAVDDSNNIWVADTRNGVIRRFSRSGLQIDSIRSFFSPTHIAINRRSGDLLVVEDGKRVREIVITTKSDLRTTTLDPFRGSADVVLDVNTNSTRAIAPTIAVVGDIDSNPIGDVFVGAYGVPENIVIRIANGNVSALAYSSTVPSSTIEVGPRLLAVDRFGTVYTSFTFLGTSGQNVVRGYVINVSNITQSKILSDPFASGAARGATIDNEGYMYIADSLAQDLVVFSTLTERTILRFRIPTVAGISMSPRDIAVAKDSSVYVVVTDRIGTDAGAVLKYTKAYQ